MNYHHNSNQRLFWSVSRPLRYLGLTLDEWGITLLGVIPGMIFINFEKVKLGGILILSGIFLCWLFKKYKRLSSSFKLKSFLISKNYIPAPSFYPKLLKKPRVGR